MNKKVILIIIGMFLLVSPLISAEPSYTLKQNEDVTFCIDTYNSDNSPATNSVSCIFTLKDPTLGIQINNETMTFNRTGLFCIDISGGDLSKLGEYPTTVNCDDGADYAFSTFTIDVTTTGKIAQVKIHLFLILCSLGLFVVGIFTKSNELGFLSGIFFTITGIYFMIYGLGSVADMYTRTIAGILIGFGLIVTLLSAWEGVYGED